ncbi:biotin biosynthesis protein [Croceicoccus naphthovorans]|uniref:Biotin biosynthesis protein n=2 Tax=Croceicoccus naphthovorans TaxID=1348774 RepID=A0A0G3XJF4_9SPHN|nr:biotin biosynthesis protein [Croceicoccus naphthovorans]
MVERGRIGAAFGQARDYDRHARVQRKVAEALADRIAALTLPQRPRILEIGCGTGFLTQAMMDRGIDGDWLITDIAPAMVERCRERLGEGPDRRFAVLDGEYDIPADGGFDLICSSLAMQWFDHHAEGLSRMLDALAQGGHCLFATLGQGTFAEWQAAHEAEGLPVGTRQFPPVAELGAALPDRQAGPVEIEHHVEHHASAIDFLRALKAIGARTPSTGHAPLSAAQMRRVMAHFDASGPAVTYEVVFGHYQRPE